MFNLDKIVRPNILLLKPYSSARDEFTGSTGVFLDANENPFGQLNRYPDPHQKTLKQKLAALKNVAPANIFIGNGSDEVIDLAFRIFCEPGKDAAMTFSPTYGMYEVSAAINNVTLIKLPLSNDFKIDSIGVRKFLDQEDLKLIFICSPNNPTGNTFDRKDIEMILTHFSGVVIIDEAYIDFSQEASCLDLIDKYQHLIVSQTFSKAWGLAAARVGVAYAHEGIIELFQKVKPPYNVSGLNQQAAITALDNQVKFESNKEIILKEKAKLEKVLSGMEMIKKVYPSDANFILVEVENADKTYKSLADRQIITRNRSSQVKNCIRISIGTPDENLLLLKALKNLNHE